MDESTPRGLASNARMLSTSTMSGHNGATRRDAKEQAAKAAALHGVVPADTSTRIRGHNFAIQLLRVLEGSMHDILLDFGRESGLLPKYVSGAARRPAQEPLPQQQARQQGSGTPSSPTTSRRSRAASPAPTPALSSCRNSPIPTVYTGHHPSAARGTNTKLRDQHHPHSRSPSPMPSLVPTPQCDRVRSGGVSPPPDLMMGTPAVEAILAAAPGRSSDDTDGSPSRMSALDRQRLLEGFKQRAQVDRSAFVTILSARVSRAMSDGRETTTASSSPVSSPKHAASRGTPKHTQSNNDGGAAQHGGGVVDGFSWFGGITMEEVQEELGYVFDGADAASVGRVTFDQTMAYIVDCALHGDVGYVAEAVPYYGSKGTHFLRGCEDVTGARYCRELGKTFTFGKAVGIVDAVASHTYLIEYPKPAAFKENEALVVAAGGKHVMASTTQVYAVDYIAHMQAVVVAGSDRGLHVIDIASSEPLFFIPTPEPCTVCVYDRSSSTIVSTSRTYHVRCFKVAAHRHSDTRYTASHVLREHSNLVTHLLPLERDGLVASAGLDGRVVIMDVHAGAVHTRFTGHHGSPLSAICYVRSFGYVASCALHADPRVWVVSAMASRSDCFRLCDTETPHTERVVAMCDVPGSPQLVSMDRNGMVKIWDLRTFLCVQTMRADRSSSSLVKTATLRWLTMVHDPAANVLLAVSKRRVQAFCPLNVADGIGKTDGTTEAALGTCEDYTISREMQVAATSRAEIERQRKAKALVRQMANADDDENDEGDAAVPSVSMQAAKADDFGIVGMCVNLDNLTVATASDRKVRVWDSFTGKLEARFDRLAGTQLDSARISAICVNTAGRSFALGFRSGRIALHAYSTGALLHVLAQAGDAPEVLRLTYLHGTAAFVATTSEGCRIHYDQASYEGGSHSFWPDDTLGHGARAVNFDPMLSLLAVGCKGGDVRIFEGRRHRFVPGSVRPLAHFTAVTGGHDVEAVCLLTGFPAIAVADAVGQILLVTTPPHAFAGRVFGKLSLRQRVASRMHFLPSRRVLYVGTDTGALLAIDVTTALRTVNLRSPCGSLESMMSSAGRSGAQPRWVEDLKAARAIQAHGDGVAELIQVPGAGILLTASSDRTVLAWTVGVFLRGEFDNTSTFGRYLAATGRPTDARVTGVQAHLDSASGKLGGLAATVAPADAHATALAIAAAVEAPVTEDDWDEVPVFFGDTADEAADAAAAADEELTSNGAGELALSQNTAGGFESCGASVLLSMEDPDYHGGDHSVGPHPAVRSVPRVAAHSIVGARLQRMTNSKALPASSVVENSADDEAAIMYHDRLRAFLSTDVSADLERRAAMTDDARLQEDATTKRSVSRSIAKATALLIDAPRPTVASDLPGSLPGTTKRHAQPAIVAGGGKAGSGGGTAEAVARLPRGTSRPSKSRAVAVGVTQEQQRALVPLLSCNSTGVDHHTVLSFGPSDPRKRVPKAYVVDTAETTGASAGVAFAVTQDRPNPPQAREDRDFAIKLIMDAEDAQREAAEASRKIEEEVSLMAATNEAENNEALMMGTVSPSAGSLTGSPSSRRAGVPRSRSRSPGSPPKFGGGRSAGSPKSIALDSTHRSVTSFDMGDDGGDDPVVQLGLPPSADAAASHHAPPPEPPVGAGGSAAAQRAVSPGEDVDWGDFKMSVNPQHPPLDGDDDGGNDTARKRRTRAGFDHLQPTAFGSVVPDHLSAEAAAEVLAMHQRRVKESREGRRAARALLPSQLLGLRRAGGAIPRADTPPAADDGASTAMPFNASYGSSAPAAAVKGGGSGPRTLLQSRGAQNRRRHMQDLLQRSSQQEEDETCTVDASISRPATTTATPEPRRSRAGGIDRAAHAKTPMPTSSAVANSDPMLPPRPHRRALATPATSIPRNGTAAQPMLPAPMAGQYSTFAGCEPVPEPSSPQRGDFELLQPRRSADPDPEAAALPQLKRTASATSSGMGPDPTPQRRFAGAERSHSVGNMSRTPSTRQRSLQSRGGTRGVPPAVRRVLQRSEAQQRSQQQPEGSATPFAFTTLGVRSIPLATAAAGAGGGSNSASLASRPGTTPMEAEAHQHDDDHPLPAITAGPPGTVASKTKRAPTPLWVNSHRV